MLQFDITNTLEQTVLTDVTVASIPSDEEESGLEEDFIIPAAALKTNEPGVVYVAFKNTSATFAALSFSNTLKFTSKEIDPTTNEPEETGYDDEYQVEDLDLGGADYVVPAYAGSFDNVWEQSNGDEASETLQLSNMKSIAGKHCQVHRQIDILTRSQKLLSNWPRRCHCNLLKAPILRLARAPTHLNCTARRSRVVRWLR